MPKIERRHAGMPTWVDVMTATAAEREGLVDFCQRLFDWEIEVNGPETGYYTMARKNGLEVCAIGQMPDAKSTWATYLLTEDVQATCAVAAQAGAQIFMPPMEVMEAGWLAMALDPVGAVVGFWQPKLFKGFGGLWEPGMFSWFDLTSADPKRALEFYQAVFPAIEFESMSEYGNGIMSINGEQFASLTYSTEQAPCWNPVFAVADVVAAAARARELGAKVLVEGMRVPGGVIAVVQEPAAHSALTVYQHLDGN